jgi:hypothetical protein
MFVGEVYANKGEGLITIRALGEILRRAEVGQTFLDDYTLTTENKCLWHRFIMVLILL